MITSDAILYAVDFCNKYKDHSINGFLINDLHSTAEFVTPFLLIQYKLENNKRTIFSMFFDHTLWDKNASSLKPIKIWFRQHQNEYRCNMPTVSSIRKFIMRLS